MKPPGFWRTDGVLPRLLWPVSVAVAAATARRVGRGGWRAPVPVICCGNVTVGGSGKTTVALDVLARLRGRGIDAHALLRGYGGTARGPRRVDAADPAALVGDEALLLARAAPTWIGADRALGARAAIAAGAAALVLDDGLQNPTLDKTLSLLIVDAEAGLGNARVLPAGPLRETLATALARAQAVVLIGEDRHGIAAALPPAMPVHRARLVSAPVASGLAGKPVFAMAGIARPGKFHATLREAGLRIAGAADFADHHAYSERDVARVLRRAERLRAAPVTTPKDAVRVPPAWRDAFAVIGVTLAWRDEAAWDALLDRHVGATAAVVARA